MVHEQAKVFFGMDEDKLTKNVINEQSAPEVILKVLLDFVQYFGYCHFSLNTTESMPQAAQDFQHEQQQREPKRYYKVRTATGEITIIAGILQVPKPVDEVYIYCLNLCHWGLHLMHMNDTTREGDLDRLVLNLKYCIPFFFSHSRLSKYFVECIDYLMKVCYILPPSLSRRVLEGSFVNSYGGKGSNVEADLRQEHSVRTAKELIRHLGANKSESAILRITNASDAVSKIVQAIDLTYGKAPGYTHHRKAVPNGEQQKISEILSSVKPFHFTNGRQCQGFGNIHHTPLNKIDRNDMQTMMKKTVDRLFKGVQPSTMPDCDICDNADVCDHS
jgi:hypothetical protein